MVEDIRNGKDIRKGTHLAVYTTPPKRRSLTTGNTF